MEMSLSLSMAMSMAMATETAMAVSMLMLMPMSGSFLEPLQHCREQISFIHGRKNSYLRVMVEKAPVGDDVVGLTMFSP
jgi:hypothetical protein